MEGVRTIYVDLDYTLLRIDLLRERVLLASVRRPLLFFESMFWLLRGGMPRLKTEIARRTTLDIPNLPFNTELIHFLNEERESGMELVLATSVPREWAQSISDQVGIFDRMLATDETGNLTGSRKLEAILRDTLGKPFGYAGAPVDRVIFEQSQLPIIVGGGRSAAGKMADRAVLIPPRRGVAQAWLRSLRLPQWSKNFLIFVPAIAAHEPKNLWPNGFLAFIAFSLVASTLYLLNDFCDLDSDRQHPTKKLRAQASGALPAAHALILSAMLLIIAVTAAIPLSGKFDLLLLTYAAISAIYSISFKHVPVLNLLTVAFLYLLRMFAGSAACNIPFSIWLFVCVFFMALSMAHLKLYMETTQGAKWRGGPATQSAETSRSISLLSKYGHTCGLISLLVLALYISSPQALSLYKHPAMLFAVCPFLFFWIERIWYRASHDRLPGDPVVFIVSDYLSYLVGIATLLVIWIATVH